MLTSFDFLLLILYALICIGIGIWSARKQKADDYLIAGRKLGTFGFISSVISSYVGGGLIVGYTAYVYQFGIAAITVFIGTGISFLVFTWHALRLRKIGNKQGFHTLSDWFYFQWGNKIGLFSAVIIFVVYFGYLMNQFIAGSSILATMSGISYEKALLFSSAIILIYLLLGGFRSVIRTDIFQYLVLFILFFLLGTTMISRQEITTELLDFSNMGLALTIAFIVYGLFNIFVAADYWQRVYAAKNNQVIKRGSIGAAICIVITGVAITLIGLAAGSHFTDINPNEAAAHGFMVLLPPSMISLALILVFATIMSSADTLLFVLASTVAKDFCGRFLGRTLDQKKLVQLTKISIVGIGLLSVLASYFLRDLIQVLLTVAGMSMAMVPSIIASFHWKMKKQAVFASLLMGTVYVVGLIVGGYLIPEAAMGSILVSFVFLLIFQFLPTKK